MVARAQVSVYDDPMDTTLPSMAAPLAAQGELELLKWSYLGIVVDPEAVAPLNRSLEVMLGEEFLAAKANRDERDGAGHYHMTVVTPAEYRPLRRARKKSGKGLGLPQHPFGFEIVGVGAAATEDSRAWFALCRSEALQDLRSALELPPHDLHITLAFGAGGDVHGVSKGTDSLITVPSTKS